MTLRTLTFDPKQYKLVPVEPVTNMQMGFAYADAAGRPFSHPGYDALLAAVPDTLPSVVEHSGKPAQRPRSKITDAFACLKLSADKWRAVCNGEEAYSDMAPALLSVAVVREDQLRQRIVELEANVAQPDHVNDAVKLVAQPVERQELSAAADDVLAERRRQIEQEGRIPEEDDSHVSGEIAAYAAYYAMPPAARDWPATETGYGETWGEAIIPADWTAPKPGDRRRELVKAGALILAEIERLDRAAINKDRGQA